MKLIKSVAAVTLAAAAFLTAAGAQDYPTRPITIIVPFPPGAVNDSLARILQLPLQESLGQPIIIENRGGAGGVIGSNMVVRSPPDGHTLLLTVSAPLVMSPYLQKNFPFDPQKQITGVAMLAETYLVLATKTDSPLNTVADVIEAAKKRPGELTFGSAGVGSAHQIVGELLNKVAGISITHVPFQGGGPSIQSLLGGHISMSYGTLPSVLPYVQSHELKLIALTESKRISELPNLPTINEAVPGVQTTKSWVGLFAPEGTPIAIRRRIHAAIVESAKKPEIIKAMAALGMKPAVEDPEAMDKAIATDLIFWKATIATAGLTAQ